MKKIIISLAVLCALVVSNALVAMTRNYPFRRPAMVINQGVQQGDLIIHNTLNEPIQWHVSMRLDGAIPGIGTISNSNASMSGYIPANEQGALSSGTFLNANTWGSTINLTINRTTGGRGLQTQIQQLGTYLLRLDANGNLVLERQ